MTPIIAIVGRPSVGKSTLFNRMCGRDDALVAADYGVTRDTIYGRASLAGHTFIIVDTGGLDNEASELQELVHRQVQAVLTVSDGVIFMVDARAGLVSQDESLARQLRGLHVPRWVIANKAESQTTAAASAEFHRLGLGAPLAISAQHGDGMTALQDAIATLITPPVSASTEAGGDASTEASAETGGEARNPPLAGHDNEHGKGTVVRAAIVGRPNTGKSTLINALSGEQRMIVMDEPGTTRDCVRVPVSRGRRDYELFDTAGVRRRARVQEGLEQLSVLRTMQALEEVVVALLVVDATSGITEQDAHLAGLIENSGRALVLAVNKWDACLPHAREAVRYELARKLRFLPAHQTLFISALHGAHVRRVLPAIYRAYLAATRELSAGPLNRVLRQAVAECAPPGGARPARLKYCHQGGRNPPRVVIHGTRTHTVPASYRRYLANRFQRVFGLTGVRVKIICKEAAGQP